MQIFNLALLFTLFQEVLTSKTYARINYNHCIRNLGFKVVIFKKKRYPLMKEYIKYKYKVYNEKIMASITEGVTEYENLSDEEKKILDLMISSVLS